MLQAEAHRSAVFESALDATIVMDCTGKVVDWNRAAERMFGISRDASIGRELADLIIPTEMRDSHRQGLERYLATGQRAFLGHYRELTAVTARGDRFPVEIAFVEVETFGQSLFAGFVRDISDRKQAEERTRFLMSRAHCLLWFGAVRDVGEPHLEWQVDPLDEEAAQRFMPLEVSPGGRYIDAWYHSRFPEDQERTNAYGEAEVRAGRSYSQEFRCRATDGSTLWIHEDVQIEGSAPGPWRAAGVCTDITAMKDAEDHVRRLNAELEDRVRQRTAELETANRELESFAYSVAHDLRGPLRGINGWIRVVLEDFPGLDPQARDYLERAAAASRTMGDLMDDLLRLARISQEELLLAGVDLSRMARELLAALSKSQPERHVDVQVSDDIAARADPQMLEIALGHLLNNAWKFTRNRPDARIEFGARQSPGETVYFVRDNGVGFDMQYAHKLFGAFQRLHTSRDFPGTGMGLAIVKRVINRHGGRVTAEGAVGSGATFCFTLGES